MMTSTEEAWQRYRAEHHLNASAKTLRECHAAFVAGAESVPAAGQNMEPVAWRWKPLGRHWRYAESDADFPDGAGELQPLYNFPQPEPHSPAEADLVWAEVKLNEAIKAMETMREERDDALALAAKLNGGDELQSLMKRNNELSALVEEAKSIIGQMTAYAEGRWSLALMRRAMAFPSTEGTQP